MNAEVGREVDVVGVGVVDDLERVQMRVDVAAGRDLEGRGAVGGGDTRGQGDATVRGNGVLLQLDGDSATGWVGPCNGQAATCCHIQGALTFRNVDGVILRRDDDCAERGDGSVEEAHVSD